jgi:alpha-1,6-mannosyltransferase
MTATRERGWVALCFLLQAIVVAGTAAAARHGSPPSRVVLGIALAFVPYTGMVVFSRVLQGVRHPGAIAAAATAALGALWLIAPPVLSDDLYRYIWEGRLWLEGSNPYAIAPNDPSLALLRDEGWVSINNKALVSIYPPLSQVLFVIAAWLGGGVTTVKLLALVGLTWTAGWVARITGDPRVALAAGLNPLLSAESALNGHFDVLVGAAFMTVAWALSRHRFTTAGIAVCVAVGLKIVGLVALPLLWRRPKALVAATSVSVLLLAPLAASRTLDDSASGPGQFATRWQGNESVFAFFDWISRQLLADGSAGLVARIAAAMAVLAVVAVLMKRRVPAIVAMRVLVWTVLLLSPQVHPWYLGWLLPLELAAGGRAALIWSAAVLCAYAPLDRWAERGVWDMPSGLRILEYSVVAVALFFDLRNNSNSFR